MSRGTIVKLLRVFPGRKTSDEEFSKILEKEKESWHSSFLPLEVKDKEFDPPKLLCMPNRQDRRKIEVVTETKEEADVLLTWYFGSGFTALVEAYNLNYCVPSKSIAFIPEKDIQEMRLVCKYLLSRKYSREIDDIFQSMDIDWLSILANPAQGDVYWPYLYRNKPKLLASARDEEDDSNSVDFDLKKLVGILDTWNSARPEDFEIEDEGKLILAVEAYG